MQLITRWLPYNSSSLKFNSMLTLLNDIRETCKTVDSGCCRSIEALSSLDRAFSLNGPRFLRWRQWRRRRDRGCVVPVRPRGRGAGGGGHSDNRGPRDQHHYSTGSAPQQGGMLSLLASVFSFPPTSPSAPHGCQKPWLWSRGSWLLWGCVCVSARVCVRLHVCVRLQMCACGWPMLSGW